MTHEGYTYGSVHLTLRKPSSFPAIPNDWAKPSEEILANVRDMEDNVKLVGNGENPVGVRVKASLRQVRRVFDR